MFEFLQSNKESYGSLFSIRAKRKIINNEWAYMTRKTGRINDTNNQARNKKVKFDKNATIYIYDKENEKRKETN